MSSFTFTSSTIDELIPHISSERFATYLRKTDNNREVAIRLYGWNTAMGSAFYGPLQVLEVTLRNSMHTELVRVYGSAWYDNPDIKLTEQAMVSIRIAKEYIGKSAAPPDIIATLSFGFWVKLLTKGDGDTDYIKTLWIPALRDAFPHLASPDMGDIQKTLWFLNHFRNRIAHHEPIFPRDLHKDHENIIRVIGWISPTVREWVESRSRVPELLSLLPLLPHEPLSLSPDEIVSFDERLSYF